MTDLIAAHIKERARELTPHGVRVLGASISKQAVRINACQQEFLAQLRLFDAARGWSPQFRSCAEWLTWELGISPVTAREKLRIAHALGHFREIDRVFAEGLLTYTKVRVLIRYATLDTEADLLALARTSSSASLERHCANSSREELAGDLQSTLRWRTKSGQIRQEACLVPAAAEILRIALEAAAEELDFKDQTEAERRAAALLHIAKEFITRRRSQDTEDLTSPAPARPATSNASRAAPSPRPALEPDEPGAKESRVRGQPSAASPKVLETERRGPLISSALKDLALSMGCGASHCASPASEVVSVFKAVGSQIEAEVFPYCLKHHEQRRLLLARTMSPARVGVLVQDREFQGSKTESSSEDNASEVRWRLLVLEDSPHALPQPWAKAG